MTAESEASAGYLDRIAVVHAVSTASGSARIYELVGGDGVNATHLALSADAPSGETSTWILDRLMFSSAEKVEALGPDGVRVEILRDTIELDGQTEGKERLAVELRWAAEGGAVGPTLRYVEGPLAEETLERSTDEASALLGRVLAVRTTNHEDTFVMASAVRRPEGGTTVLLTLGGGYMGSRAFDLDLRVDGLASIAGAGRNRLRLTTTVADETGQGPTLALEIAFAKAADGIAETIRLARAR